MILGWGLGGEWAVRTTRRRDDLAACVTFYGARRADLAAPWPDGTPLFAVFGTEDASPGPAVARPFVAQHATKAGHDVRVVEGSVAAMTSPYWTFGTGYPAGKQIHARARLFLRRLLRD